MGAASARLGAIGRGHVSIRSRATTQHFVIQDLDRGDAAAVARAAGLMVEAFPHWTPTLESAREEVAELLTEDRICLVARANDEVLGWVGGIPAYSHAWELHPLVVREDVRGQG